jgi:hypothetical protein
MVIETWEAGGFMAKNHEEKLYEGVKIFILLRVLTHLTGEIFSKWKILDGSNSVLQMPVVGTPSIEWCNKKSFPHKGDSGLLLNSQESLRLVPYLRSSSNLQQQTNSSAPPTNCGGCQSPIARKINKTKGKVTTRFLWFLSLNNWK